MSASSWWTIKYSTADATVPPVEKRRPFCARSNENPISSVKVLIAALSKLSTGFVLFSPPPVAESSSILLSSPMEEGTGGAAADLDSSVSIGIASSLTMSSFFFDSSLANRSAFASSALWDPPSVFPPAWGIAEPCLSAWAAIILFTPSKLAPSTLSSSTLFTNNTYVGKAVMLNVCR